VQVSESREMTNQNNIANYINDQRRKARERFEEMSVLDGYHTGERVVPLNLIKGLNHKYYPFAIEF